MVAAAWRRHIPAALTEADSHLGLANRLAAPFARRVFLAFPVSGREGGKYRVTGRPVPARSRVVPRREARELFDLPAEGPVLLVFGGSQGAQALNEFVLSEFGSSDLGVLHLSGQRDFESLRPRANRAGYRLLPYTNDFGAALGAADLVLARAGGSVWELAAAGKPAVLVPYPHGTGDHQTGNARYFERAGGAVVVQEAKLSEAGELVRSLIGDAERLRTMGEAMLRAARPNAAEEIADELIALAGRA
jgi:UDP-N-acetylglucosamine--N-acetylmuramyl-(pentapeptide) pyrophosphoryl-undecaprenol N-acetylglucosamine transferase